MFKRGLLLALLGFALPVSTSAITNHRLGTSAEQLTNTTQVLLRALPTRTIIFCVIQGGAASNDVVFHGIGGTPVYVPSR